MNIKKYIQRFRLVLIFVLRDIGKNRIVFRMVILTISIGSLAILLTASVFDGFQNTFKVSAQGWLGDIIITPSANEASLNHVQNVVRLLRQDPRIHAASVRNNSGVKLIYKERTIQAPAIGIEVATERMTTQLANYITTGAFLKETQDTISIVVGVNLADNLVGSSYDGKSIQVGDLLQGLALDGSYKSLQVAGIMKSRSFVPDGAVLLQKNQLEKLEGIQRTNAIVIKLRLGEDAQGVKQSLQTQFPDMTVHTWLEESNFIEGILKAIAFITFCINQLLMISIFIVITVVIYINVLQKRRQIGILKSMGATNAFIVVIYMAEACWYLILSYVLGVVLFTLINAYSVSRPIPMEIGYFYTIFSFSNIGVYFLILLGGALLGSLIPSRVALRTSIIDVLRNHV